MNHENDADPDEGPDATDRPAGRRVRSLPGPRPNSFPAALGAPSPSFEPPSDTTPVAEVSLSPSSVYVTVELPGAPKDALDIEATATSLRVLAPRLGAPKYRLDVDLPAPVDPKSAKATYRNGILDVTLARVKPAGGEPHEV